MIEALLYAKIWTAWLQMSFTVCMGGENNFFIGETSATLKSQIDLDRHQIGHPEVSYNVLSKHISQCGSSFPVLPIFRLSNSSSPYSRHCMKTFFINKLEPTLNWTKSIFSYLTFLVYTYIFREFLAIFIITF